jgi:diguanylate cyclase
MTVPPPQLAKGALRRLAQAAPGAHARELRPRLRRGVGPATMPRCAPTGRRPDAGNAMAQADLGGGWSALVERLARNLERGGRQWTAARKKESLRRVLDGSRSDAQRLQQRLQSLIRPGRATRRPTRHRPVPDPPRQCRRRCRGGGVAPMAAAGGQALQAPCAPALPARRSRAPAELADGWQPWPTRWRPRGPRRPRGRRSAVSASRRGASRPPPPPGRRLGPCAGADRGLTDLAEDDSWARGQCAGLQARLADGLSARGVRAATVRCWPRRRPPAAGARRTCQARDALKQLIQRHAGRSGRAGRAHRPLPDKVGRHARPSRRRLAGKPGRRGAREHARRQPRRAERWCSQALAERLQPTMPAPARTGRRACASSRPNCAACRTRSPPMR